MVKGGETLFVTADDFGISERINRGIMEAHHRGIVTSASLLIACPAMEQALALAKTCPELEIGLHLAFVESPSATGIRNSLTASQDYFPGGPCLLPHWKAFLKRWALGKIKEAELWRELCAQCEKFLAHFPEIPFLNSTQHLHLLPGMGTLVARLCQVYPIRRVRMMKGHADLISWRGLQRMGLQAGSRELARILPPRLVQDSPDAVGFERAGRLDKAAILRYLANRGPIEIMSHPGEDEPALFDLYPGAFRGYQWSAEKAALCDSEVIASVRLRKSLIPGAMR